VVQAEGPSICKPEEFRAAPSDDLEIANCHRSREQQRVGITEYLAPKCFLTSERHSSWAILMINIID